MFVALNGNLMDIVASFQIGELPAESSWVRGAWDMTSEFFGDWNSPRLSFEIPRNAHFVAYEFSLV